jgi:hypothetical protein
MTWKCRCGPVGVAAVAEQPEDLAGLDPVAGRDPQRAGLQMGVEAYLPPMSTTT